MRVRREETVLYNASTVITLSLGVLTMAAAVYVLTVLGFLFFLEPSVCARAWAAHHPR